MGQKIVITANMSNKTQRIARKDVVYQWHWRRIAAVAGVTVIASSALWYVASTPAIAEQVNNTSALPVEQPLQLAEADHVDASEAMSVITEVTNDVAPEVVTEANGAAVDTDIEQQSVTASGESAGSSQVTTISAQAERVVAREPEPVADPTDVPQQSMPMEEATNIASESELEDQRGANSEAVATANEFSQEAKVASLAQGSKIDTDKVSRAVLTTQVVDREPVSALGRDVSMADFDGQLVFFSELRGMQGQKVSHIWYYENQEMASVELGVHTARYRTFSSKNIMPTQTGLWRVELRDNNNKLLATREFRLTAKP